MLEKTNDSRQLLYRYLGIDPWRVLQVLACSIEYLGNLELTCDHRAQALLLRSKIPLHNEEDRVSGAAGVLVRVLSPHLNILKLKKAGTNRVLQNLEVGRIRLGKFRAVETLQLRLHLG